MPIASSQRTVVDCPDPGLLARFYGAVLGWEVGVRDDGEWAGIWSPDREHSLRFQRVEGYRPPDWPGQHPPQQMHVDLRVDDGPYPRILDTGCDYAAAGSVAVWRVS